MSYSSSSSSRRDRHRRSMNYSSSSSPSRRRYRRYRDENQSLEDEIIDRALDIERRREEIFRQQFHFIVSNVKELERRRNKFRRERTHSPRYDRSILRKRSSNSICFQLRMIYRGNRHSKHGEEIQILQHRHIVFKGFLNHNESFTFRIRSIDDGKTIEPIELKIFIDEFRLDRFVVDLQNGEIHPSTDRFQIESIQPVNNESKLNQTNERSKEEEEEEKKKLSIPRPTSIVSRSKENERIHSRPTSSSTTTNSHLQRIQLSRDPTPLIDSSRSTLNSKKKTTTTKKSDEEDQVDHPTPIKVNKKETPRQKPTYGPPQLSTFVRSDSDGSDEETKKNVDVTNKSNEETSLVKKTDNEDEKNENDGEDEGEDEQENNGNRGSGLNFFQLLQAMAGGGIRIAPSNDDSDGIQSLLTRLGIGNDGNQKRKTTNVTPRECGNVENYLFVYLDKKIVDENLEKEFRSLVNFVKMFDDADDCLAFINSISDEKVIFVVSDELGDPVVSRIQDLQQVFKIYIRCENVEQVENWSTNQPKIRGIYTDLNSILEQIRRDIDEDEEDLLSFTLAKRELNLKEQPDFLLDQIIKEILLDPDEMNEAKKELIDFARQEYQQNQEQLDQIQAFEDQFSKENLLEFYQPNSFIYKMLKKGFRVPDAEILFKLRFFIQNLHQLIISSSRDATLKRVYRSRWLKSNQIETLRKQNEGTFLSFSHFFIASKEIPSKRIRSKEKNHDDDEEEEDEEEILFEIELDQSQCQMSIDDENLFFTFGVSTRIENISKDQFGRTKLHLKVLSNDDQQIDQMIEPMRKEIRAPYPSLRLVKFFIELEEYSRAVLLGQALLADWNGAKKDSLLALARIYHSLGTILYEKEQYDQALDVIKKSHSIYLRFLPEDSPQLSPTWNNMGSIYLRQGKTELALEHHEKALSIQLKSPSPDLPSIISYSNNIGGVYLKLERFDEALVHFKRAVQIEEQTLPKNHPELAGSYHRIGGVYFRQNNFEKALEFYNKTLEVELNALPSNHPTIAVTYHNRGTAFEGLGRLEEAVESAEKAVEQLLKTLPKENPQVRMNQAYVDRLKQKLWVKQLFSTS